jgi:aspartate racemase
MHKVADALESSIDIPLLHIADATADEIKGFRFSAVGLLGTRFTMEQAFYRDRLASKHGLEVIVPDADSREIVHGVIYDELCLGRILEESKSALLRIIDDLGAKGAQGVILGCTELPLLIGPQDSPVPTFDTTALHARKAVTMALGDGWV